MTYPVERMDVPGASFSVRQGTSDSSIVMGTFGDDEYRLRGRSLSGWAMDLGAHIGVVAAALLARHPDLRVIAVEPLPENVALLQRNLAPFGDRALVVEAAAATGKTTRIGYAFGGIDLPENYRAANRFIGRHPVDTDDVVTVPSVSLAALLAAHGIDEVALIKTDCEGGELAFFADPKANAKVHTIVGEYHDGDGSEIRALLEPTHDFTRCEPATSAASSTGLFEAVRR